MKEKGIMYIVIGCLTLFLAVVFFDDPKDAVAYGAPYIFLIAALLILASGIGSYIEGKRREKDVKKD